MVAKKFYCPTPGQWPGLASSLYFNVSSQWREQVGEDVSMGATLKETFHSWYETLDNHAWCVLKLLKLISYLLVHTIQSETEIE